MVLQSTGLTTAQAATHHIWKLWIIPDESINICFSPLDPCNAVISDDALGNTLNDLIRKFKNQDTSIKQALAVTSSIKTTNQLNSFLHDFSTDKKRGGAGRGKIPCQPTSIARRNAGKPRGAASLGKGRKPGICKTTEKKGYNLALNVSNNEANGKCH